MQPGNSCFEIAGLYFLQISDGRNFLYRKALNLQFGLEGKKIKLKGCAV
jgi:hypothetical protein